MPLRKPNSYTANFGTKLTLSDQCHTSEHQQSNVMSTRKRNDAKIKAIAELSSGIATAASPSVVNVRVREGRVEKTIINQLDLFDESYNSHNTIKFNMLCRKKQLTLQWWKNENQP